jgi:hypothetical protein
MATFYNSSQFNKMITTTTFAAIKSDFAKGDLCLLENTSSAISDQALDEVLKRALEEACNIESPVNKKQKKESWDFCEQAKVVVWPQPSVIESATRKTIVRLGSLTEDNRLAKIAIMLQKATDIAQAVGKLDPEAESHPNGRRRFQRRNSFVIHRNGKGTGTFSAPVPSATKTPSPSTTKITSPLNEMRNEADSTLEPLPPCKSNLLCRRMSVSWSQSLNHSSHSTRSNSSYADSMLLLLLMPMPMP